MPFLWLISGLKDFIPDDKDIKQKEEIIELTHDNRDSMRESLLDRIKDYL